VVALAEQVVACRVGPGEPVADRVGTAAGAQPDQGRDVSDQLAQLIAVTGTQVHGLVWQMDPRGRNRPSAAAFDQQDQRVLDAVALVGAGPPSASRTSPPWRLATATPTTEVRASFNRAKVAWRGSRADLHKDCRNPRRTIDEPPNRSPAAPSARSCSPG
jgi:hypothetical protein